MIYCNHSSKARGCHKRMQEKVSHMPKNLKLKAARAEKDMTQAALAEVVGVSRQTINAIENQKYDPSLPLAFQLARILGTTVDALFLPKLDA